jgi:integrase
MSKSKKNPAKHQSAKPYPDYPLTAHPSGRWCKKIKGKLHYFGRLSDPETALQAFLDQKDDLFAGRVPRAKIEAGPTLRDLANHFLTAKKDKLDRGDLSARSFYDLHDIAGRLIAHFGKDRLLTDITPADFAAFQRSFPKTWGPYARARAIQITRSVFLFGMRNGIVEKIVQFGDDFRKPSKSVLRRHRAKARIKNGVKMFEADEVRQILGAVDGQLKAMVLLSINAGCGPSDLANLTSHVLDLDRGWLDYPRPKSGIARRCPLWAETIAAVKVAIAQRPAPKDEAAKDNVFITKYGHTWMTVGLEQRKGEDEKTEGKPRLKLVNAITAEFNKVLRRLGLKREGRSIYSLRHSLQTIGGEARDPDALRVIMGHVDEHVGDHYRERIGDDRLERVSRVVHDWLFPKQTTPDILPMTPVAQ